MFKSVTFGDQRLVCESCEVRLERLLKGLPGIGHVRAQAPNQRIEVLFDSGVLLDPSAIAERLGTAGAQ